MKSTIGIASAIVLCLASFGVAADVKLDSDTDKEIYALGLSVARSLSVFNLNDNELQLLQAGIATAFPARRRKSISPPTARKSRSWPRRARRRSPRSRRRPPRTS